MSQLMPAPSTESRERLDRWFAAVRRLELAKQEVNHADIEADLPALRSRGILTGESMGGSRSPAPPVISRGMDYIVRAG